MFYRPCHVHETSPGTHTLFPTYTCPVYCWRSVQLLDFDLCGNLIHASQPIRSTFTGQWFASGFLQTPPHDDALAIGCTLPTAGRVRDFHPLERVPAGHTAKKCRTVNPALCTMEIAACKSFLSDYDGSSCFSLEDSWLTRLPASSLRLEDTISQLDCMDCIKASKRP